MAADEITVGVVSWYEADLIDLLYANLLAKTSNTSHLHFLVCDNTNGQDRALYERLSDRCTIISHDQGQIRTSSYGHAQGLQVLLANVKTELTLFVDADCMVLRRDWDLLCKKALSDRVVAVGTPYPPTWIQGTHGFPVAYFMLFQTGVVQELATNWMPYGTPPLITAKDFVLRNTGNLLARYLLRTVGRGFFLGRGGQIARAIFGGSNKDTGWRVTRTLLKHGYAGRLFDAVLLPSQLDPACRHLAQLDELTAEFQLFAWEGWPIVTHLWSHSARRRSKHEVFDRWLCLAQSVSDQMEQMQPLGG